ncbi:MAG: hypothetical protein ACTHK2_15660 [Dokdonella sp.]|uniref:hypothetical protein n=1 Tax=Dokdonella sp. TaxID=2291710 RepID=UPI003F7CECB4
MSPLAGFLSIALISFGLLAVVLRTPPRRGRGCDAPSNEQRLGRFHDRLDERIGLHSETYLERLAIGLRAHARLMAGMRPHVLAHQAPVPAGPVRIRYTGQKPRGRAALKQRPLPFAQR